MKKYRVIRTDTADTMLHRIILYVAENFGAEVALEKLEEIESAVSLLATQPEMGVVPKYSVLRRQGYRVLILKKNLVFYKVNHETRIVTVYAVFDARQDYFDILTGL